MKKFRKRSGRRLCLLVFLLFLLAGGALQAQAASWTYGSQLSGTAKEVYKALSKTSNWLKYNKSKGVKIVPSKKTYKQSETNKLVNECYKGVDAFLYDHCEVFWINNFSFSWSAYYGPKNTIILNYITLYPLDCYDGIRKEIKSTQTAIRKAVNYVKKRSGRYARVKAAHDYIVKIMDYSKNSNKAWHHTVTGGLLAKYNHKSVCEGYAKLFNIICKEVGIPCIRVIGGTSSDSFDHTWNYVQMGNGKWYLVDVTYDDPYNYNAGRYIGDYLLAGSETDTYTVYGKVKNDHKANGRLRWNQPGKFKLPALSKTAFKRPK